MVESSMPQEWFINNCRLGKIGDKYLLSTDHGGWFALTKQEYRQLISHTPDKKLLDLLSEQGIVITTDNIHKIVDAQTERLHFLFRGASLHIVLPTLRCNQKCIYCHSSAHHSESISSDMTKETAERTVDFIFQTPAKAITIEFQGGEPLLNDPIFKHIIEYANIVNEKHNKIVRFALVTNITLLNDELIKWCDEKGVEVCTSLDGPESIHNKNRPYENGQSTHQNVTERIQKYKSSCDRSIGALMVTTTESLDKCHEVIDEYVKQGLTKIQLKYLSRLGYAGNKWDEKGYSAEEFVRFWKEGMDYLIKLNKEGGYISEVTAQTLLLKIIHNRDPSFLDIRSPCGAVIGQMAYNYNGDIYSCDEGRNFELFKLGNVKKDTYAKVVSSKKARSIINASINESLLCDACIYKPYCGTCPVLNLAEENNLIPKLATNSKCKILKAQFRYLFEKLLMSPEDAIILLRWIKKDLFDLDIFTNKQSDSRKEIARIVEKNNLGKIESIEEVSAGLNKTFIINNRIKLKLFKPVYGPEQESKRVQTIIELQEYLQQKLKIIKLLIPKAVETKGRKGLLFEWIDDKDTKQPTPKERVATLARVSAQYHEAIREFRGVIIADDEEGRINLTLKKFRDGLKRSPGNQILERQIKKMEDYAAQHRNFEKIIIHKDLRAANLIGDTLIDLDSPAFGSKLSDIGISLASIIMEYGDFDLIRLFLGEYLNISKLNPEERKQIMNSTATSLAYLLTGEFMWWENKERVRAFEKFFIEIENHAGEKLPDFPEEDAAGATDDLDNLASGLLRGPFEIKIELTGECNNNCPFCQNKNTFAKEGRKNNDLALGDIKNLIDQIVAEGITHIRLTGGEPTLRSDFLEILDYAHKKGLKIAVNTNMVSVTRDYADGFAGKASTILVPMHAYTPEDDKKITGTDNFERKIELIKYIKSNYDAKVCLDTIGTPKNIRNLEKFADMIKKLGVDEWFVAFPTPVTKDEKINSEDVEIAVETLLRYKKDGKTNFGIGKCSTLPLCAYDPLKILSLQQNTCTGGQNCGPNNEIVIGPDGTARPCYSININLGNIRQRPLREILNNPKLNEFKRKMLPSECSDCRLARRCAGGCRFIPFLKTGCYEGKHYLARPEKYKKLLFKVQKDL